MEVLNERLWRRSKLAALQRGGGRARDGERDRTAGSLLITLVFNIRKCQNGNGARITLSIALLGTPTASENRTLGRTISSLKWSG